MTPSTEASADKSQAIGILISEPRLWRLLFERRVAPPGESEPDNPTKLDVRLSLQVARLDRHRIGTEVSVEVEGHPDAAVVAAYRSSFTLSGGWADLSPEDLESRLSEIARGVAPSVLYPYLREAIGGAASRAGLRPITLPIVNFRGLFADQGVVVPPYEGVANEIAPTPALSAPARRAKKPRKPKP